MIQRLPRVVPAPPGKPARPHAGTTQAFSARIAEDSRAWSRQTAADMIATYADLAGTWNAERGAYRTAPVRDALDRGGPWPCGTCLDIGAGTGLMTDLLATVWPDVVSLDISVDMLTRSTSPHRIRADAARLPLRDAAAAAVVVADALLFAAEVSRVLRADGVLVWSNALGRDAPHHVPPDQVHRALRATSREPWTAIGSEAGWGTWTVFRRGE